MAVPEQPGRWWAPRADGIELAVRVTPGARQSEVIGGSGDRLRLRVAAPASEGKANTEVKRLLAKVFGVRRSAVTIVRGERARDKAVRVAGVDHPPPQIPGA